jgi:hypothetical protein
MSNTFNAEAFLQQTYETSFATAMTPVPEGDWTGQVEKIGVRTTDKGQAILDLTWQVLDDQVKQALGMDKPTVRQSLFLDLDANGKLDPDKNKNVQLGRVREALGQNDASRPWGVNMLIGGLAKIKVGHRPDSNDPTIKYGDVKGVAKLAG